jgi:NAD(P)-dependent dehydrogenase (short-subunit alcohol dehydrogenase family)
MKAVSLKGRSFIVTGGTRGIGRALAKALLVEGARVAISGRDRKRFDQAVKEMKGLGGELIGLCGDVGSEKEAKKLAEAALSAFGRVDFLINNAGIISEPKTVVNTPSEVWEEVLRVNVVGTVNMIRHVLPSMQARKSGVIVNLSSGWGRVGEAKAAPYCASKFAVEGLTQAVAAEAGPGVVVAAVNPGIIATDMLFTAFEGEVSGYPSPEEAAPRWLRLLSKLGPSLNGRSLDLDDF